MASENKHFGPEVVQIVGHALNDKPGKDGKKIHIYFARLTDSLREWAEQNGIKTGIGSDGNETIAIHIYSYSKMEEAGTKEPLNPGDLAVGEKAVVELSKHDFDWVYNGKSGHTIRAVAKAVVGKRYIRNSEVSEEEMEKMRAMLDVGFGDLTDDDIPF